MKRVYLKNMVCGLLTVNFLFAGGAFAEDSKTIEYPEMKTSSKFSRIIQTMTGFTALSGFVANRVIKKELTRHIQGNLKSNLKLYSGTDLIAGKAREFSISGKDVTYDDFVPLSEFQMKSDGEMPLYIAKDKKPFLLRPMKFKVSAVMSEEDMNKMLQSKKGQEFLSDIKFKLPPFGEQHLDALQPSVNIVGGNVVIKSLINMHEAPKENALPVEVIGKISSAKAKLKLSDLNINVEGIDDQKMDLIAELIEEYFSDLANFNKIKVDRHKLNIAFDKTELKDDKLFLEATVTVKPEDKLIRKYLGQK